MKKLNFNSASNKINSGPSVQSTCPIKPTKSTNPLILDSLQSYTLTTSTLGSTLVASNGQLLLCYLNVVQQCPPEVGQISSVV